MWKKLLTSKRDGMEMTPLSVPIGFCAFIASAMIIKNVIISIIIGFAVLFLVGFLEMRRAKKYDGKQSRKPSVVSVNKDTNNTSVENKTT